MLAVYSQQRKSSLDILLLAVLLVLSASFSGTETAYFSLSETDRASLPERRGGHRVALLLGDPSRLLAALLIGNLLINIVASVVAASLALERFGTGGVVVAVPLMTVLLLLIGEITPKMLALRSPLSLALAMRIPLGFWLTLMRPLLALVSWSTVAMLARLPADRPGSRHLTPEELAAAASLAMAEASLTETEGRFLARLLVMDTLEVLEIMTPRPAVVAMDPGLDRRGILELAERSGFNRYPVMGEHDLRPVAVMHLKDLLDSESHSGSLRHQPMFVPETKSVATLLREMKVGTSHMAFVVDEHGDYVGLVTLEDCLEAMTGAWADESDRADGDILPVAIGNWVVNGLVDLRHLNEVTGGKLEPTRDAVTLGGYVLAALGKIPQRGDRFTADGFRFTVLDMESHRVARIRIQDVSMLAHSQGGSE